MRFKLLVLLIIIAMVNVGCTKIQKSELLENPEKRIYVTFDKQTKENKVQDINEFNIEDLKELYLKHADYEIKESELVKEIVRNDPDYTIIDFSPVVSGVELNNTYVVQLQDGYISSIATNPSKFNIPKEFDTSNILSIEKREKLKEKLKGKFSKQGLIDKITDRLYFDCHEYGKVIYIIKVSVDTEDYSFAKIFIYDAYSGELLGEG